jgi:hypothetical protein
VRQRVSGFLKNLSSTKCVAAEIFFGEGKSLVNMVLDDLRAHGKRTISSQRRHGRARLDKKVGTAGRGRKTDTWVSTLYVDVKDEFLRFRHAGLKVRAQL